MQAARGIADPQALGSGCGAAIMNAEEERYVQACNQESLKLGPAAARLYALRSLKLKTAIKVLMILHLQRLMYLIRTTVQYLPYIAADVHHRVTRAADKLKSTYLKQESHCSPVHQLLFNAVDPRCSNLVASVGNNQVSMANLSAYASTKQGCKQSQCASVEPSAVNVQQSLLINASQVCACLAHQATVYDNQHLGSHIGVTVHFTNEATEHSYGGVHSWSSFRSSMLLGVPRLC